MNELEQTVFDRLIEVPSFRSKDCRPDSIRIVKEGKGYLLDYEVYLSDTSSFSIDWVEKVIEGKLLEIFGPTITVFNLTPTGPLYISSPTPLLELLALKDSRGLFDES